MRKISRSKCKTLHRKCSTKCLVTSAESNLRCPSLDRKRPLLSKRNKSKSVSRYGVDLDYSSSSSASASSSYESDSSTDFGSLSDASADNGQRKKPNWNKSSSKERKRRRQRKLASRLSTLLAEATVAGGSPAKPAADGKKKPGKSARSKGLGAQASGIGATLDEWDRWEMMSQQQALVRFTWIASCLLADAFSVVYSSQPRSVQPHLT
jgi:hypothetical protein